MEKAKKFKLFIGLFYLTAICLFLYFFFSKFSLQELTSYDFIRENRSYFFELKNSNLFLLSVIFLALTILWVFPFLGFGSPVALMGGFIFGKWIGTLLVVLGLSIGATFIYLFGNYFLKELIREKVVLNPVPFSEMIDAETGYIVLTEFNEKASFEVKKAFKDLQQKGMKKLVFDLRSNPGGSLLEAINITNFFISKGKTIVSTKAKVKSLSTVYRASNEPLDLEMPIVVLINRRSASASEIVSGALQDHDRAVIMGQRSFGKGLVQRYKELTYGTQLKVTISKYYTPSGRCIQELDYTNRDPKTGEVPKFSDRGIQAFKTENGRTVYNGGGVTPDIVMKTSKRLPITEILLDSKAIFNFGVAYLYKNPTLGSFENFRFTNTDFKEFTNFLAMDTTFITKQEKLFQKAFEASKKNDITKEYQKIKERLVLDKISEIAKNEDIITEIIKEEILKNYFYEEGWYQFQLKNDQTILKATELLKNSKSYSQILSSK